VTRVGVQISQSLLGEDDERLQIESKESSVPRVIFTFNVRMMKDQKKVACVTNLGTVVTTCVMRSPANGVSH
jgi:hypothetical protein